MQDACARPKQQPCRAKPAQEGRACHAGPSGARAGRVRHGRGVRESATGGCTPATGRDRRKQERITMAAKIIDGKALAARIRGELAVEAKKLHERGCQPGLAVILVGEDPASQIYVRNKTKALAEAGYRCLDHHLPATTSEAQLLDLVRSLCADRTVDGILVQVPLP